MILDPILDLFRGKAVTIPPLDGAFRANTALDEAPVFAHLSDVDNLCVAGGRLYASHGATLRLLADDGEPATIETFASDITAIAAGPDGVLAVALDDGSLFEDGEKVGLPGGVASITALAYGPDGSLWLANGSERNGVSNWVVDLMEKNASGSIWRRKPGGSFTRIASDLAWPFGLLPEGDTAVVSESWRHRLVRVGAGSVRAVSDELPGYPARLVPTADGGAWLALFAPRNRLIELVLQEKHYRYDMMASVPREFWIAPALASGHSFLEPLQCGGIRTMGVQKAWAPSRSHGLVVRLDSALEPVSSLHSRANGTRHGTTSIAEFDGRLLVASRGGGCILAPEALS